MSSASEGQQADSAIINLSFDELQKLKQMAAQDRPWAPRLSAGLAIRILMDAKGDAPYIRDAIDALEGERISPNIKPCAQFKRPPLHPLWHQHFFAPRHMLRNIGVRWGMELGGNRDLDLMISEVARDFGDDPARWPGAVAHRFMDAYVERSRARRLTGDWIVFAKHCGVIYYLDLASHE